MIETTHVYQTTFNAVSAHHAYLEGEGDKSLVYWRKAHIDFFKPYYASLGLAFNESTIVVCEEFKVLYNKVVHKLDRFECALQANKGDNLCLTMYHLGECL